MDESRSTFIQEIVNIRVERFVADALSDGGTMSASSFAAAIAAAFPKFSFAAHEIENMAVAAAARRGVPVETDGQVGPTWKYFFHVVGGVDMPDTTGRFLHGEDAARAHAKSLFVALGERGPATAEACSVRVTDEAGVTLFAVQPAAGAVRASRGEQGFIWGLVMDEVVRVVSEAAADGGVISAHEAAAMILQTYPGCGISEAELADNVMMAAAGAGVVVEIGQPAPS